MYPQPQTSKYSAVISSGWLCKNHPQWKSLSTSSQALWNAKEKPNDTLGSTALTLCDSSKTLTSYCTVVSFRPFTSTCPWWTKIMQHDSKSVCLADPSNAQKAWISSSCASHTRMDVNRAARGPRVVQLWEAHMMLGKSHQITIIHKPNTSIHKPCFGASPFQHSLREFMMKLCEVTISCTNEVPTQILLLD